jgi:predicted kinase
LTALDRPIYVLLNGAFGVGKTSVAGELQTLLPRAVLFDPEWVGLVLMRLPGCCESDFQHLPHWRKLSILGARAFGGFGATVIIPMAFSDLRYLREVRCGLEASGRTALHYCLTAPLEVVRARLAGRGEPLEDSRWA